MIGPGLKSEPQTPILKEQFGDLLSDEEMRDGKSVSQVRVYINSF